MTDPKRDPLDVDANEFGTLRLFAAEADSDIARALTAETAHEYLGGLTLNPEKIEVAKASTIEGLGLAAYLQAGYGISRDSLASRTGDINGLSGTLVFLPASAFGGLAQHIEPASGLRFIGLFHEEKAAPPRQMAQPETAKGTGDTPDIPETMPADGSRYPSWLIVLGALLLAAALFILIGL